MGKGILPRVWLPYNIFLTLENLSQKKTEQNRVISEALVLYFRKNKIPLIKSKSWTRKNRGLINDSE